MKNSRVTVHLIIGVLLAGFTFGNTIVSGAPPVKEDSLAGVTQNWDKNLPISSRFTILSSFVSSSAVAGAAIRDNNTGLVWDYFPDSISRDWATAAQFCLNKKDRGPMGWRLPSVAELKSLQNPTLLPPFVPPGVFTGIQPSHYWSATTSAVDLTKAWLVDFGSLGAVINIAKSDAFLAWCVRGPMNAEIY